MTICIKTLLRIVSELVVKQVNCTAKLDLKWRLVLFIKKISCLSALKDLPVLVRVKRTSFTTMSAVIC